MKKSLMSVIISFLLLPIIVNAGTNHGYSQNYYNECVNNHSCILLCGYTNKVQTTADFIEDKQYNYFSSYIYYDFNEKIFFVDWLSQETDIDLATHSYEITRKYVFTEESAYNNLKKQGVCPKISYIDVAGVSLASEVCFADNEEFCTKDSTDLLGTKFKGESTLEYDYQNQIEKYYETWKPNVESYTCEMLQNKEADLETPLVEDYSQNFLYGNSIPEFMKNSSSYLKGLENLNNEIENLRTKCDGECKEKYNAGLITEDEYNGCLKKNEDGAEDLKEQLEDAENKIEVGEDGNLNLDLEEQTCQSLLGHPEDEGTPAFYLALIFNVLKYVAIILIIVLTIMDFIGAVASQDNDILKKATMKVIKRLILCAVIFVLPTLIKFALQLIYNREIGLCGIGE